MRTLYDPRRLIEFTTGRVDEPAPGLPPPDVPNPDRGAFHQRMIDRGVPPSDRVIYRPEASDLPKTLFGGTEPPVRSDMGRAQRAAEGR